jgi:hypothetical protein
VLADGQPQPGLRQVCLASFPEATLQHEKLNPSIGKELDRGSGGPLLYPDILAGMILFGPAGARTENARQSAQATALVVWLLGKTGAGKTAIIAALTGDTRAEVGLGFEPCTRTAAFYDIPPEAPLLRFLDTRGVGEVSYDAGNDM